MMNPTSSDLTTSTQCVAVGCKYQPSQKALRSVGEGRAALTGERVEIVVAEEVADVAVREDVARVYVQHHRAGYLQACIGQYRRIESAPISMQ